MFLRILTLMSPLFSSMAMAQAAPTPQGPTTMELLVPALGFLLIFYFFVIRPQQARAREHQAFLSALKPGDEVVTSGGIIGRVKSVAEGFVNIEIAGDTVIKVLKSAVEGQSPKAQSANKS